MGHVMLKQSKSQLLKEGKMSLLTHLSYILVPWKLILLLMQAQATIKISSLYLSCQQPVNNQTPLCYSWLVKYSQLLVCSYNALRTPLPKYNASIRDHHYYPT